MAINNCYKVINCRRKRYRKMWTHVSPPEGHAGQTFFVEVKPDQFSIGLHVKQRIERARAALEKYEDSRPLDKTQLPSDMPNEAPFKRYLLKIPAERFFDALRDAGFHDPDVDPDDLETKRLRRQIVH